MFDLTCSLSESATEVSFYNNSRAAPSNIASSYDVIVVGGGTAGSVLANSLSSNPKNQVLVLEAGPRANWAVAVPLVANVRVYDPAYGFQIQTLPQKNLENRRLNVASGKVLGGSSAVNVSVFTKSCHEELRRWVSDYGLGESWSPENLEPFLDKPVEEGQPPSRHSKGPLEIRGIPSSLQESLSDRVLKALENVENSNFSHPHLSSSKDDEGKGPIGIGSFRPRLAITRKGWKSHASNSFLPDKVLRNRSNLRVCTNCRVDRIHLEKDQEGKLVARGVWIKDSKGSTFFARATEQIILSAGAFHTPPILLRSGIGPSSDLTPLSIPVQLDSPKVGKGLSDHIGVILHFLCPYNSSTMKIQDGLVSTLTQGIKNSIDFLLFGKGIFISPGFVEVISYLRSFQIETIEKIGQNQDKEVGLKLKPMDCFGTVPDIEIIFSSHWMETACRRFKGLESSPKRGVFAVFIILTGPTKNEESFIKLNSLDPFDNPLIDPKHFENPDDLNRLLKAVKLVLFLIHQMNTEDGWDVHPADIPGFDWERGEYRFEGMERLEKKGNFYRFHEVPDDVYLSYIRQNASAVYHPSSTCRMGSNPTDPIDPSDFSFKGVGNLKVCDASIFPHVPSNHPQSLVFASAEKLGELLRESS